jgi:glycosyltransferase involved in cell wall biosynthesis
MKEMHHHAQFDAILSFDLLGGGGTAWRMGRELQIPAAGWAFGSDVRSPSTSPLGRVVARALKRLDLVFYQSHELLENAARLLGVTADRISHKRHVVLPHGIPEPPSITTQEVRRQIRSDLGINDNQLMVLSIGRIVRSKGIFELLDAFSLATAKDPRLVAVIVGSTPTFDETAAVREKIAQTPRLGQRVILLPSCNPEKVWEYLCAADIFAFTSHQEGMPNSLLEGMALGISAVAFAIPPVLEIDAGAGALVTVPPLDSALFSEAILRLAASPDERLRIGQKGKAQVMERFMVRKNMAKAVQHIACMLEQPHPQP